MGNRLTDQPSSIPPDLSKSPQTRQTDLRSVAARRRRDTPRRARRMLSSNRSRCRSRHCTQAREPMARGGRSRSLPPSSAHARWRQRPRTQPAAFGRRHAPSPVSGQLGGLLQHIARRMLGISVYPEWDAAGVFCQRGLRSQPSAGSHSVTGRCAGPTGGGGGIPSSPARSRRRLGHCYPAPRFRIPLIPRGMRHSAARDQRSTFDPPRLLSHAFWLE